jgi:hypothetical protein
LRTNGESTDIFDDTLLCADGGAVVEEVLGKIDLGHGRALGELSDGALDLLLLPGGHGGAATRGARTRAIRCTTPGAG